MPPSRKPNASCTDIEVGEVLRAARATAGLGIHAAEAASGISRSVLSRIERGTRSARVSEIVLLAAVYETDTETLFDAFAGKARARKKLGL
jgi:transcriptional regulator with XRE-family HTH domain